jgi:PKD repeat protein
MVEIIGETAATPPVAVIVASKTNPLVNELVTFDGSNSYDPDGTITGWNWQFGDSDAASDEVVQHSYSPFGSYTVTLTVSDGTYTNSTQETITAIDYPTVMFTYSPLEPLVNETVSFDAATSLPKGGSITDYSWSFGDGQTGAGSTVTHSYSATGAFTVTLTLTDSEGLTNSTSKEVTVTIHNVAITSVTASPNTVEKEGTITLQITASNKGNYTESFTVIAYYNTTAIKTEPVNTLSPGGDHSITIVWNTASAAVGAYILKAEASTVNKETMTSDNSLTYGSVAVQKITSALSITASSTTVTLGRNTIIHGTLGPARIGTSITIQYRPNGGEWSALATVISDAQAQYILNWRPQESGTYEIQAIWLGDADTKSCQSTTETVTVQEGGGMPSESILTYGGIIAAIVALVLLTLYLLRLRKK